MEVNNKRNDWPWKQVDMQEYDPEQPWPKISIVTPSYNQGQFIEETILSILNQKYPNLEYIIIDGGSTDNSVDIIKKYSNSLTYWLSEPDKGQADAINKGLKYCTGEIFNWINSDDLLAPNALYEIANSFDTSKNDALAGAVLDDFDNSYNARYLSINKNLTLIDILKVEGRNHYYHQPGVWFKKSNLNALPPFDCNIHYYFDWEFMLKYLSKYPSIVYTKSTLVLFRAHENSKSIAAQSTFQHEIINCYKNLFDFLDPKHKLKRRAKKKYLTMAWHNDLLRNIQTNGYSFKTLMCTLKQIVSAPQYRCTRLTLGQMRKFLIKQRHV